MPLVTLDLGRPPALRVRGEGEQPPTEVLLDRSAVTGRPVQVSRDRRYLHRALQLGFSKIRVASPAKPLVCRDERRILLWMPLGAEQAIQAAGQTAAPPPPEKVPVSPPN